MRREKEGKEGVRVQSVCIMITRQHIHQRAETLIPRGNMRTSSNMCITDTEAVKNVSRFYPFHMKPVNAELSQLDFCICLACLMYIYIYIMI
jgi:NADH:ubiquinone oxidoreductase subunit E